MVTKTRARYEAAHKAWATRCQVAKKNFAELNGKILKDLLSDLYMPIMSLLWQLKLAVMDARSSVQAAAQAMNGNDLNQVLEPPTRRKIPSSGRPEAVVINDSE